MKELKSSIECATITITATAVYLAFSDTSQEKSPGSQTG